MWAIGGKKVGMWDIGYKKEVSGKKKEEKGKWEKLQKSKIWGMSTSCHPFIIH